MSWLEHTLEEHFAQQDEPFHLGDPRNHGSVSARDLGGSKQRRRAYGASGPAFSRVRPLSKTTKSTPVCSGFLSAAIG